jgi:tetratricopeptide (TPR) repeat protein
MSEVTEYVVCPACGTRIKAGRGHCLRCFELLPDADAVKALPIWESLGWSRRQQSMVWAGASLVAVMLLVAIVRTGTTETDATAHPTPSVSKAAASIGPARPALAPEPAPADEGPAEAIHAGSEGDEPFLDTPSGTADKDAGRYEKAVAHFKRAATAVESSHWTRAISEYGTAASLLRDDAAAHYNFALALHRRGDEREAIAAFQRAIELAPDQAMFHLPLAVAFENVGQIGDAAREYRAIVSGSPDAAPADRARKRLDAMSTGNPGAGQLP